MKIAILTLPLNHNYGGILQAYALQTILERMGHNVTVLDVNRYPTISPYKALLAYPFRFFKRYIKGDKKVTIRRECLLRKRNSYFCKFTEIFIRKNINRFEYSSLNTLPEYKFDALVVGSDQIWRPVYFKPIENAFLNFARDWNIKRIAYATSFGTDKWEYSSTQTEICKDLVNKFNAISVRESSGVKLCNNYFNIHAQHVLDPTMLLGIDDYLNLLDKSNIENNKKGRLLVYILDNSLNKQKIINFIAEKRSLEKNNIGVAVFDESLSLNQRIQPPVEDWLQGFVNANFVVTDSFHACVFSILFNKPFIAIGNIQRGISRFSSLLNMFNLQDRLIDEKETPTKILTQIINWEHVNNILKEKKEYSLTFLKSALQ